MNLVKVQKRFFDCCKLNGADPKNQLLHNEADRPCVLLLKLNYKGKKRDFVVPLKSNIKPNTDRKTFFPLPPNPNTRENNFHGIYYIKLFPIQKKYLQRYQYSGNPYLCKVKSIIDKNERNIVNACQRYLDDYSKGKRNHYTPELDLIIDFLDNDL